MKKKTFNYFLAIVALAGFFSCSKTSVPEGQVSGASQTEQTSDVTERYVKLYFDADMPSDEEMPLQQTKMAMSGLSVVWQGTETINIWYKDAGGAVQHTAATIESYSGKKAILSAVFPETAPKDEFIAELNGVADDSGKLPFGTDTNRPRVAVPVEQTATLGSFDPAAYAMGARWVGTSGDKPSFLFKNLTNLLKITVDNNTGKTLKKIVLSCNEGEADNLSIVSKNYWNINDNGSVAISGGTVGDKSITLSGNSIADGDYYFVISAKNATEVNRGNILINNMKLTFYFEQHNFRSYSNTTSLNMGGDGRGYSKMAEIGSFTIGAGDLVKEESVFAPFDTKWTKTFAKTWYDSGTFVANQVYEAAANAKPGEWTDTPMAYVTASNKISSYGNFIQGAFTFEFYAAQSGTGILSFSAKAGAATHTIQILVNDTQVGDALTFAEAGTLTSFAPEITVAKGDKIKIKYMNGSNYAYLTLYTDSIGGTPVHWKQKPTE